ncbi:MAG: PrkA family serine protein kinase [Persicimonas sp.]
MTDGQNILSSLASEIREDYGRNQRILSFAEFLDLFADQSRRHARNAVQYLRDAFLYYGTQTKPAVWGDVTHYRLFDAPFDEGKERLVGQERAQQRVFRLLDNFVRQGEVNKLILLHGPNGSAKSTFLDMLMRALEAYSETDEGAMYRFNWVFPNERMASGSSIGFEGFSARAVEETDLDSFAYLDEDQIDAKIPADMKDHPLLLVPLEQRRRLLRENIPEVILPGYEQQDGERLRQQYAEANGEEDKQAPFVLSKYIYDGDLSHTSRQIFDALMTAYKGDIEKVFKHIQVERIFVSRRYRMGAVVVEPQMRVDANLRQLTVDRSLGALPSSLQNQTMFEPFGDLVDANRGLVEYDDLLKRQPELNKYLLATSEKGTVSLENRILHLDLVLTATANEDYLDAFKQTPDYSSFKGRIELVRLPYLLDYNVEEVVYDEQMSSVDFIKHLAPHTTAVAALWATLTRLKRPKPDRYPAEVREIVSALTPLEKADLYSRGKVPEGIGAEKARELKRVIPAMMSEGEGSSDYEGRYGASPREMKMILLNASQNDNFPCLSPLSVFEELRELVKDPSVFPFLQMKTDGDFHDHDEFIEVVTERYLELIDAEIRSAMGLVEEAQYEELFARYIDHVSQWLKGEKVYNRITGRHEEPDEELMGSIEEMLDIEEDIEEFRHGLISTIAAYSIDHPGEKIDYRRTFPTIFEALQRKFYEERQQQIRRIQESMLRYFEDEKDKMEAAEIEAVETTLDNMRQRYGYCDQCAREAVAFLLSNRYNE